MNELAPSGPPAAEGIVTRSSPFTVAETLQRLRAAIQSHNLKIFAEIDHAEAARQVGLAMHPAHVLIFGSPRAGTPLMNAAPLLALDLPLRLLVWQSADEQVWVSSTSAAYLQARYGLPAVLIGNIAGADAWIAQALAGSQA
jgi:uncharacterized protein (DUF302 family)